MSLAIYRKYRPTNFAEVVGQEYLVEIMKNTIKKDRFAHAYLFYGPRGTGKTTTARLIAKAVNCLDEKFLKEQGEPCNKCRACQEIGVGRAMDVVEIDAASNRGIDEIRGLKEGIRVVPSSLRRKVFIIDETHMLTKEAFNALLKILEEPPEHAMLILATTEYEKIPATISSRTQRFHLQKLTVQQIVNKLKKIVKNEQLAIAEDALELIAAAAEGGLRDAESLLDQVASLTDQADLKSVESIIGRVGFRRVLDLFDYLMADDLKGSLKYVGQLTESGTNLSDLNKELIKYCRRAMALKLNPELGEVFKNELTTEEYKKLEEQAARIDVPRQINLIKSLIRAFGEMRYSPFPQVPLEIALIENLRN